MSETKSVPTMGVEDSPDAIYDARHARSAQDGGVRPPAHVRDVRRHHLGADADWAVRVGDASVRRSGHALVPFRVQRQSAGVSGIVVRVHCGLCGHRAERRGRPSAVRLSGVACAGLLYLVLAALFRVFRSDARHALLPAGGHRPHRDLHRPYLGEFGHRERFDELACRARGRRHHCGGQHLGQGHGEDRPHPAGRGGSYAVAAAVGEVDFSGVAEAAWIGLPVAWNDTALSVFGPNFDAGLPSRPSSPSCRSRSPR